MEIKEIIDKKSWEGFMSSELSHTFLESWNWGKFNSSLGYKTWRFGVYENGELIGVALVMKIKARRGRFLFIPHGPILKKSRELQITIYEFLIEKLKDLAAKENCSFIRISPILKKNPESEKLFKDLGFRNSPIHMHAELMWVLDIEPGEESLLGNMRKTTRYLIKKARSDGVKIIISNDPNHVSIFNNIYEETAKRQIFVGFSRDYLEKEFDSFIDDNQIQIFLAEYQGEFVAGAMIIFYGDLAFYHQGASLNTYPKISAPYLLQWEIILEAKRRGMKIYNFWGISPDDKPDHPWAGLSLFKKGFGGEAEELIPDQDLILKSRYWLTFGIERLRRARRGL